MSTLQRSLIRYHTLKNLMQEWIFEKCLQECMKYPQFFYNCSLIKSTKDKLNEARNRKLQIISKQSALGNLNLNTLSPIEKSIIKSQQLDLKRQRNQVELEIQNYSKEIERLKNIPHPQFDEVDDDLFRKFPSKTHYQVATDLLTKRFPNRIHQ